VWIFRVGIFWVGIVCTPEWQITKTNLAKASPNSELYLVKLLSSKYSIARQDPGSPFPFNIYKTKLIINNKKQTLNN